MCRFVGAGARLLFSGSHTGWSKSSLQLGSSHQTLCKCQQDFLRMENVQNLELLTNFAQPDCPLLVWQKLSGAQTCLTPQC